MAIGPIRGSYFLDHWGCCFHRLYIGGLGRCGALLGARLELLEGGLAVDDVTVGVENLQDFLRRRMHKVTPGLPKGSHHKVDEAHLHNRDKFLT